MTTDEQTPHSTLDTRTLILDATEHIMIEHGYAGVSSRKVSEQAGLKSKLIHYYFKTMDELFIAAFQRLEERYDERFAKVAASKTPLHDLWNIGADAADARLILEFNALATHRPAIREIIGKSARRDRKIMAAALEAIFERYNIDRVEFPPKVMAILMAGLGRTLAVERTLGSEDGHVEALEFLARLLARFEKPKGGSNSKAKSR